MFTVTLEDDVADVLSEELGALDDGLHHAAIKAAEDGIAAAKAEHPYTDRTWNLTNTAQIEELSAINGAEMWWPMEYGSFVNYGTSRSRPYPFVPLAKRTAKESLSLHANAAAEKFSRRISR